MHSKLIPYPTRLVANMEPRPEYGHLLLQSAIMAKKLGLAQISVIEFGVASGEGLIALEYHASKVHLYTGVEISIYGFDSGKGLPKPKDYRDMPYIWQEGFYKMNLKELSSKINKSVLIIGNVSVTIKKFSDLAPPPIGAIIFDLDYYSSTKAALKIFENSFSILMPRIFCYFDDVVGDYEHLFNEYTGERLAINEFNQKMKKIKITKPYLDDKVEGKWNSKIWVAHIFQHPKYNKFISVTSQ